MRLMLPLTLLALALTGCRNIEDADEDGHSNAVDCNDENAAVNPSADEVCDGVDTNCNGIVDDVTAEVGELFYADFDGDGYGTGTGIPGCDAPAQHVAASGDCNDDDALINPGAEEDCESDIDANCDGSSGFDDADNDGFAACDDCDDTDATVHRNGVEVCDGADNDCDGTADNDSVDATNWYSDKDADGFGDGAPTAACEAPVGSVSDDGDCDDQSAASYPGAAEVCDAADNDCDGDVDDNATDADTWYIDADDDGFGGTFTIDACIQPAGFEATSTDCDDGNAASNPDASEICDGGDNDCDGDVDEDPIDAPTWYADTDGDRFGDDADTIVGCDEPEGYVDVGGDCDDTNTVVRPGMTELCDGLDDDCNGVIDDGFGHNTFYEDADGDGVGSNTPTQACVQPPGYATVSGDCDDSNGAITPGAPEECEDTIDNNCDDLIDCEDIDDCKSIIEECWECGDEFVDPDETCDDGGFEDGDGCDATCQSEFQTGTFTACGAGGENGPSQLQCDATYLGTELEGVTVTGGYQTFELIATGTYRIEVFGAEGGDHGNYGPGGRGARVQGDFDLDAGQVLKVLVGQRGRDGGSYDNGAGGGTYVALDDNTPLIVAGGGGAPGNCGTADVARMVGHATIAGSDAGGSAGNNGGWCGCGGDGSGGGGWSTDGGGSGGLSFLNGGTGDTGVRPGQCVTVGFGGFGGGGNGGNGGGGGGGYQGGEGGGLNPSVPTGEGGYSYNQGANPEGDDGFNSDDGYVIITLL